MGCVYTPRGLKIRVAVQDVFIYLSRVWHPTHERGGYTAFQGLRIVEDIVNFPEFISWTVAVVMLSIGARPVAALVTMIAVRLFFDVVITKVPNLTRVAIAPLWRIVRPYSFLTGRGVFLVPLVVIAWLMGGWVYAIAFFMVSYVLSFVSGLIVSSEVAFVEALYYMANKCGVVMSLKISEDERDDPHWALCYAELVQEYPVVSSRFVLDDGFQAKFSLCLERLKNGNVPTPSDVHSDDFTSKVCERIVKAERTLLDESKQIGESILSPLRTVGGRGAIRGSLLDVVEFTYGKTFGDGALNRFADELDATAKQLWDEKAVEFKSLIGQMFASFDYAPVLNATDSYVIARCMSCESALSIAFFKDRPDDAEFAKFRYRFEKVAEEMYSDIYDILDEAGFIEHSEDSSDRVPSLFDNLDLFEETKK